MKTPKRLTEFMEAALEDAFDKLKSVKQMEQLQSLIDQKMSDLINVRSNSHSESPAKIEELDEELEAAIDEWQKESEIE